MITISNLTGANVNGYATPATSTSPVVQTADAGLTQTAVSLSLAGDIVSMLEVGPSSYLTYDAAGLLNNFVQAGTAPSSPLTTSGNSDPQATAQNSTNQGIVNTLPASPLASGVYDSSGTLQGLSSNTSANWATALKANPDLAAAVTADSYNQGIVGTLSITV